MSSYKTPADISEEVESGEPNTYARGSWAWIEYERVLREKERIVDNKYRVSYVGVSGEWLHHDTKDLDSAISFAKIKGVSVTQITEKEVWSYSKYEEDRKARLNDLVEQLGLDRCIEVLEALPGFRVEIVRLDNLHQSTPTIVETKNFETLEKANAFCTMYNRNKFPGGIGYYFGFTGTYARIA